MISSVVLGDPVEGLPLGVDVTGLVDGDPGVVEEVVGLRREQTSQHFSSPFSSAQTISPSKSLYSGLMAVQQGQLFIGDAVASDVTSDNVVGRRLVGAVEVGRTVVGVKVVGAKVVGDIVVGGNVARPPCCAAMVSEQTKQHPLVMSKQSTSPIRLPA